MSGYIITLHLWDTELVIAPERDCRYKVHKADVYPFRCVAEQVAERMPRMAGWPPYRVKALSITQGDEHE